MKKILYCILIILFLTLPINVLAEGYISIEPSSVTIEKGSSAVLTITAYNVIGDMTITSNDTNIATVSASEWQTGMGVEEYETVNDNITVFGNNVGTTSIVFKIDAASFDEEDLSGQTKIITVNVIEKSNPQPSEPTPPSVEPTPSPSEPSELTPSPSNPTPPVEKPQLSTSNKIKKLSVEGYEVVKINDNSYTLFVDYGVSSINVEAVAEDEKAKVSGGGKHELQVGENNIEIVITSESGSENKISLKVTRKDRYYYEDLNKVLQNDELKTSDIIINSNNNISTADVNKIKESRKEINFNYYNEDKKLIYSWIIDGKDVIEAKSIVTNITFTTENDEKISELANNADGMYVNFAHSGSLPTGTSVKLYVGDKFENNNIVNLYYYNEANETLDLTASNLKVVDGYVEFDLEHCSEYFVTKASIEDIGENEVLEDLGSNDDKEMSSNDSIIIVVIVLLVVVLVISVFILIRLKMKKKVQCNFEK